MIDKVREVEPDFVFIAQYSDPIKIRFGKLFIWIFGFGSLLGLHSLLFVEGIQRLLDLMLIGIFSWFIFSWIWLIYSGCIKIVRIEFFKKHLVIVRAFQNSRIHYYDDVIDFNSEGVKVGKDTIRFGTLANGQELNDIFINLIKSRRIREQHFTGEIGYISNLYNKVVVFSIPLALLLTWGLLWLFSFSYAESRLLYPFVLAGVMWILYCFFRFLDTRK